MEKSIVQSNSDRTKKGLRSFVRSVLKTLPSVRSSEDHRISENLAKIIEELDPCVLAAYMAFGQEPDLTVFLTSWVSTGRPLYLPRYMAETGSYEMVLVSNLSTELTCGHYRILEPSPSLPGVQPPYSGHRDWLWLVPGLAFDGRGNRLGRGNGYYDRLLSGADGVKIGVGYECQIVDSLPSEPHDVRLDYVVTESQIRFCDWQ